MPSTSERPFFSDLPLHDVTREYGEGGLRQRLSYEINQTDWSDETRERLRFAEELAIVAHKDEDRGTHPYSTHFLRVAIRIISRHHLNVKNPDILIAALLHDTVENNQKFYTSVIANTLGLPAREHAIAVISSEFGNRVGEIVLAVTNSIRPPGITLEEKHTEYQEHVRTVLHTDEEAGIVKLSDFIDNCAGLAYNEDRERALRMADKYLPLIPDFYDFVAGSTLLTDDRKQCLFAQLERAENQCLDILEAAA